MELELSIGFILALNVIFAVTIVFFERRNPTATTAWLMVLFFLPPVGFVLYLLLGQNYTRGEDKFDALFAAIRMARHHIHLEYFVVNDDALGQAGPSVPSQRRLGRPSRSPSSSMRWGRGPGAGLLGRSRKISPSPPRSHRRTTRHGPGGSG